MLRFIRLTGLRLEEFRRYHPSWLRPAPAGSKTKALLVVPPEASKTRDGRTLPLNAEALAIAKQWGSKFKGKKFNHALWLASAAVGVSPPLTPRDLRATYITHVARRDLPAAQRLAGHTNVATTGRYVELDALEAVEVGVAVLPRKGRDHSKGSQPKRRRRRA
jgi:integrase